MKGISLCVLAIESILFSNCYVGFYSAYCLQRSLLENNIITDDAQRKITVEIFQLKPSKHVNIIRFQVFIRKIDKRVAPNKSRVGTGIFRKI